MTRRRRIFALMAVAVLAGLFAAPFLVAKKEPEIRKVKGLVIDAQDNPIARAIVYLKNLKTQRTLSKTTGDDGSFLFSDLDKKTDYELHAEYKGAASPTRTLTQFDSRLTIMLNLKIAAPKP